MKDLDKFKNEMNLSGKNVYVGHRYVPKIFGEWDNTKIYEPLSIVQYQGASYTSRQYVPVGVELTNEEFWVVTGNYNAQVEQYRQDVANVKGEVTQSLNVFENTLKDIAVNVTDFGASELLDDNSSAFNEAAQYCLDNGYTLTGVGEFNTKSPVTFKCNINMPNATIKYTGDDKALIIGDNNTRTSNLIQTLPKVEKVTKTWVNDIGIELVNIYSSHITIPLVSNFSKGLVVTASGENGNVYNNIYIGHLLNNKINLLLELKTIDSWVNENLFMGGRYSHFSNEGTDVEGVSHIKLRGISGSQYQPNNNIFVKPSIEGHVPYYTVDIHGNNNTILQGRFEGEGQRRVIYRSVEGVTSRRNDIINGYNVESLEIIEETGSQWNTLSSTTRNVLTSNGTTPSQVLKNTSSGNYPVTKIIDPVVSAYDRGTNNYNHQISAYKTEMKRYTDENNRLEFDHGAGKIKFGDGVNKATKGIGFNSSVGVIIDDNLHLINHAWNNALLRLGEYYLWVDGTGALRIKNGKPLSDTDGKLV